MAYKRLALLLVVAVVPWAVTSEALKVVALAVTLEASSVMALAVMIL
jgi:hypothetical protein